MRVSVIQSSIEWEDPEKNLQIFEEKITEIAPQSDIVLLPEMFTTGFSMKPEDMAEQYPGRTVSWMRKMAIENKTAIAGSHIAQENGNFYNRMIFTNADGSHTCYDKRHLFRMANEDQHYEAGNKRVVVHYAGWRILLLVCYDLRFPVWSRNQNDYDLILLVANFPERRRNAWNTLLSARAIENQCYVAACNIVGTDGNGINYSGDSQIIDPLGQIIASATPGKEETINATLLLDSLRSIRDKFPAHLDADKFEIL